MYVHIVHVCTCKYMYVHVHICIHVHVHIDTFIITHVLKDHLCAAVLVCRFATGYLACMGSLPPFIFWSPSTGRMQLRKRLHSELVDLSGIIHVFCHVRPVISEDGEGTQADVVVHPDRDNDGVCV